MLLVFFFALQARVSSEWSVKPLLFFRRGNLKSDNLLIRLRITVKSERTIEKTIH